MLRADFLRHRLRFRFEARTSRDVLTYKDTYILRVWDDADPDTVGVGECNLFRGLGADDLPDYEHRLRRLCDSSLQEMPPYPSIIFGAESALADLRGGGRGVLFPSDWTAGRSRITINGLVWMGDKQLMARRIREKLDAGFRCLKLKIGGIDFDDELALLGYVRSRFPADVLQLRLDANGAFHLDRALERLERLAVYGIHSIEQPIRAGQPEALARVCTESPIPVALDEELIGMRTDDEKRQLLQLVRPAYVILKPALCGGLAQADRWISIASDLGIGWWATSALESNVGLNAIAQWTAVHSPGMPQGLGTGLLYTNNFDSPLRQVSDGLEYDPACADTFAALRHPHI